MEMQKFVPSPFHLHNAYLLLPDAVLAFHVVVAFY